VLDDVVIRGAASAARKALNARSPPKRLSHSLLLVQILFSCANSTGKGAQTFSTEDIRPLAKGAKIAKVKDVFGPFSLRAWRPVRLRSGRGLARDSFGCGRRPRWVVRALRGECRITSCRAISRGVWRSGVICGSIRPSSLVAGMNYFLSPNSPRAGLVALRQAARPG